MKKILMIFLVLLTLTSCIDVESNLKKETGVSVEKEEEIRNIFKECGFENAIVHIKYDDMLDDSYSKGDKGYRIDYNNYIKNVILFLYPDGSVSRIRWADKDFYLNGKKKEDIREYFLTNNEIDIYMINCQETISQLLVAPSTAKFPNINHWRFRKDKGKVIIQSYVDSQNGFGAMIRSEFQFIIDSKTSNITSLIFDGKELIKQTKKKKK